MKRVLVSVVALSVLGLAGCTGQRMNTNVKGMNVLSANVETIPMEVGIKVGEKITGSCEYSTVLGFKVKGPTKYAYGAQFENSGANIGGPCTNAALYEAITNSNSDIIINPKYFTEANTFGCLGDGEWCISRSLNVTVTGLKGSYEEFKKIDPKMRELRELKSLKSSDEPLAHRAINSFKSLISGN